jgi:hypothetical protein
MKRPARFGRALVLVASIALTGCSATTPNKVLQYTPDPVAEARAMVQAYANGQPLGSEMEVYDDLVVRVTAKDAAKGEKLARYLAEVRTKRSADAAGAKKFLADF